MLEAWPSLSSCGQNERAKTAVIEVLPPEAPPPPLRRIKLGNIRQIRAELSRVYREARCGKIDSGTATRLAYLLDLMSRMIERGELEERLEALEGEAGK